MPSSGHLQPSTFSTIVISFVSSLFLCAHLSFSSLQMSPPRDPQLFRDPWAKREAWRSHPVFSRRQMFARAFPGFGVAVVAFTAYVIADNLMTKGKSH